MTKYDLQELAKKQEEKLDCFVKELRVSYGENYILKLPDNELSLLLKLHSNWADSRGTLERK
jgi:hypothetical protein